MTLIKRVIDGLKPKPMTAQELNMEALWYFALAGLELAFGALIVATIAIIRTETNPRVHPMLPNLALTVVMWAGLTLGLGVIATAGASWRSRQERKAKPSAGAVKEVCDGLVAKFPEAK